MLAGTGRYVRKKTKHIKISSLLPKFRLGRVKPVDSIGTIPLAPLPPTLNAPVPKSCQQQKRSSSLPSNNLQSDGCRLFSASSYPSTTAAASKSCRSNACADDPTNSTEKKTTRVDLQMNSYLFRIVARLPSFSAFLHLQIF